MEQPESCGVPLEGRRKLLAGKRFGTKKEESKSTKRRQARELTSTRRTRERVTEGKRGRGNVRVTQNQTSKPSKEKGENTFVTEGRKKTGEVVNGLRVFYHCEIW